MPKDNNDKSWPYQGFHNANKRISMKNLIWSSYFHEYNNSGEMQKTYYKCGKGTANSPGSTLYEASYTGTIWDYSCYSVKK